MKSIFVTATGTDIGKTGVSLALATWGAYRGLKTAYYKPVQCGSFAIPHGRPGGDGQWIKYFVGDNIPIFSSYQFNDPVSPHLAGERDNAIINPKTILDDYHKLQTQYDFIIVEGVGGVSVPLNREGLSLSDIFSSMDLAYVLVCSPYIGTLNHSLLSHHYLRSKERIPLGYMMCHTLKDTPDIFNDNVKTIGELTDMKYLGEVPFMDELQSGLEISMERQEYFIADIEKSLNNWWIS